MTQADIISKDDPIIVATTPSEGDDGDGGGVVTVDDTSATTAATQIVVEVNAEQYAKIRLLRKLIQSGVPEVAVKARCKSEQIKYEWIQPNDGIQIVMAGTTKNPIETVQGKDVLFRWNNDDRTSIDFVGGTTSPLVLLVKLFIPTIQRRRHLMDSAGTNNYYMNVPLIDLQNSIGSFRMVQYDRDLYKSTIVESKHHDDDHDHETIAKCKRYRFLQHLSSIGIRIPQPLPSTTSSIKHTEHDVDAVIPGLDALIAFISSTLLRSNKNDDVEQPNLYNHNTKKQYYTFDELGEMFTAGMKCLVPNCITTGVDCIVQIVETKYEQGKTMSGIMRKFIVRYHFVCSSAHGNFGIAECTESLLQFDTPRRIDTLSILPLNAQFFENDTIINDILQNARQRGILYERITMGNHYMGYRKGSFYPRVVVSNSTSASRNDGRIMVDVNGSYEAGYSVHTGYDPMIVSIQQKTKEFAVYIRQQQQQQHRSCDSSTSHATTSSYTIMEDGPLMLNKIPQYLVELTWPAVTGFSFTSKVWGDVLVDSLYDIQFNETSFDRLVLPIQCKRMIKALVRHSKDDSFQDIITGKGEGSVFLLYGPPGVGKTLTAEAMSEMLHRPLYTVSLGQLGTTPSELEKKMGDILDLCSRWDALILLDEADIFLEKRGSSSSLERNAMVSVMLRLVEYFKGVLFLTSNRVDSLDPAFRTRITLALRYEPLNAPARGQVWYNLLTSSGQGHLLMDSPPDAMNTTSVISPVNEKQNATTATTKICTKYLAVYELNGREIKNCIRLALALAAEDGIELTQQTLIETIQLMVDFNEKLKTADVY